MKCLVISPRNGKLKITRFTAGEIKLAPKIGVLNVREDYRNLHRRMTAPLILTKELESRLCGNVWSDKPPNN